MNRPNAPTLVELENRTPVGTYCCFALLWVLTAATLSGLAIILVELRDRGIIPDFMTNATTSKPTI